MEGLWTTLRKYQAMHLNPRSSSLLVALKLHRYIYRQSLTLMDVGKVCVNDGVKYIQKRRVKEMFGSLLNPVAAGIMFLKVPLSEEK